MEAIVYLYSPGWDASPLQGYPPALSSPVTIYTPGWRARVGGGGVLPEKLGRVVRPASQNPYPIYDQKLRYFLPYVWPFSVARYNSSLVQT